VQRLRRQQFLRSPAAWEQVQAELCASICEHLRICRDKFAEFLKRHINAKRDLQQRHVYSVFVQATHTHTHTHTHTTHAHTTHTHTHTHNTRTHTQNTCTHTNTHTHTHADHQRHVTLAGLAREGNLWRKGTPFRVDIFPQLCRIH